MNTVSRLEALVQVGERVANALTLYVHKCTVRTALHADVLRPRSMLGGQGSRTASPRMLYKHSVVNCDDTMAAGEAGLRLPDRSLLSGVV